MICFLIPWPTTKEHRHQEGSCNETEILCQGSFYGIFPWDYTCESRYDGCPVTCLSGQHVCTTPPLCEDCSAVNYCSEQPCPIATWFAVPGKFVFVLMSDYLKRLLVRNLNDQRLVWPMAKWFVIVCRFVICSPVILMGEDEKYARIPHSCLHFSSISNILWIM